MYRKILFIIVMVGLVSLKTIKLNANDLQIVPPQKPSLSSEEIIKKYLKILFHLQKNLLNLNKKKKKLQLKKLKRKS